MLLHYIGILTRYIAAAYIQIMSNIHKHQWQSSIAQGEVILFCETCKYKIDMEPLASSELMKSMYISAQNIYHTICYESDGLGAGELKSYNLEERLTALDMLTLNRHPREVEEVKVTLRSLRDDLVLNPNFYITNKVLKTSAGEIPDSRLGVDLSSHEASILATLKELTYAILASENYSREEAEIYLALLNFKLEIRSYIRTSII